MSKYQVVLIDPNGTGRPYKTNMSARLLLVVSLLALGMFVFLGLSFLVSKHLEAKIAEEKSKSLPVASLDSISIPDTATALEHGINAVYYSDLFAEEIFQAPAISIHFDLDEFYENLNHAKVYAELMMLYDTYNEENVDYLLKILGRVDHELIKREEEYNRIIFYLRQREVIAAHTPNTWPTERYITSHFGFRRSPITGVPSFHEGVDIGAYTGTRVVSTADGVVVFAGSRSGYGWLVTVDHGFGYVTRYAHNSKLLVQSGQIVKKGDPIALSGSSGRSAGPHVHYEVLYYGMPMNALKFIPGYN